MKKFSKNYLYYHLVADIFIVLALCFAFLDALMIENEAGEMLGWNLQAVPFFILGALLAYGALIFYRVLYLRYAGYVLAEGEIRVTRGVFFRKNSIVEYKKMHAINKKQNIVQRLFGLAVLTVDSGSANTSGTAEILIYESAAQVERLIALLKAKKNGETETQAPIAEEVLSSESGDLVFSSGKKIIYSLLNIASTAFTLLCIAFFALVAYFCLVPVLSDLLPGGVLHALVSALAISAVSIAGFSVFSFVISILQSFIAYHNFRIVKNAADLEISYGLFTRHTNTFGFNRIQGVLIRQGLIQRLFGYATLNLEVIGYREGSDGNQNNAAVTVGMLLPLCNAREADEILASVLPSYVPLKKEASAKRYFPFISWSFVLIAAIFALVGLLTFSMMHLFGAPTRALLIVRIMLSLAFFITLGIRALGAFLAYKNAGISISEDRITVFGGGYQRCVTTLLRRSLIAVEDVTTPLRARAGIYTLILHLRTNAETNEVKAQMLSKEEVDRLLAVLPD